jgi:hypothetical protein
LEVKDILPPITSNHLGDLALVGIDLGDLALMGIDLGDLALMGIDLGELALLGNQLGHQSYQEPTLHALVWMVSKPT